VRLESLLPRVAHRQWTLSLPFSVRFQVVKKPTLLKRLEVRLVKAVWRWQRREARRHGATGALTGGAICFWQWFGSSLQLTPHLHLVVAEAQWGEDGTVAPVAAPSDEDVARILARVLSQAKKDWASPETGSPMVDLAAAIRPPGKQPARSSGPNRRTARLRTVMQREDGRPQSFIQHRAPPHAASRRGRPRRLPTPWPRAGAPR
jgi:hypothetical protein